MRLHRVEQIAFAEGRSAAGPATWGQSAIWDVVRRLGDDAARYNVSGGLPLDPPLPLDELAGLVRALLLRHDSLRTTLRWDGDRLDQVVHAAGAIDLHVRAADDVTAAAYAFYHELQAIPFDAERELPVRAGVVTAGGRAGYLILSLSHTASDGWGLRNLLADAAALAAGRPLSTDERTQPLEEAEYQASDKGRRRDAAARRAWLDKLGRGPASQFPDRAGRPPAAAFPNAVLNSPALALALARVAAGLEVNQGAVLLAAAAGAAARLGSAPEALFQVVVNNRFLPGMAGAVNTIAQEGLLLLPDPAEDFPGLVRRTFGAALSAQRHAYYDKLALTRDLAGLVAPADHSCFVNDTRGLIPIEGYGQAPDGPLTEALARTTLSWPVEHAPRRNTTFALDAQDAPGSLELAMTADAAVLPRPDMERMLYGIEDLVVTQALALEKTSAGHR
ncbi:condensation domain-containing protein [Dactylosporangium sp. CS-047395]|uniref:condensation domain-containing protein n=1 Tax=Dactylosporangium sp. CS-047395 TaxID=3239936 RepID=UPI003D8CB08C